jgi:hypothetical protein
VPILATGRILVSFCPGEKECWEYLDVIEGTSEQATDLTRRFCQR